MKITKTILKPFRGDLANYTHWITFAFASFIVCTLSWNLFIWVPVLILLGLAKELIDAKQYGYFNYWDMVYNIVGIVTGITMYNIII